MAESKWLESWEKNFDNTFKSIGKFKDDLKQKPRNLTQRTHRRCRMYLELLIMELEEMNEVLQQEENHWQGSEDL